jgi:hypothetical protein
MRRFVSNAEFDAALAERLEGAISDPAAAPTGARSRRSIPTSAEIAAGNFSQ